jgi:magnesium transporter
MGPAMSTSEQPQADHRRFEQALEVSPQRAAGVLAEVHAADAASWLQDVRKEEAWQVFSLLSTEEQADLLEYAEDELAHELVTRMSTQGLREVVEELPSDKAADVLAEADEQVAADVLEAVSKETAEDLRTLISYDPDSAGGVMTTEFVLAQHDARLGDVVKKIKKEGEDSEENLGVFVVDGAGVPVGYISDRDILTHSIHDSVGEVMADPFVIAADEDQEVAASMIAKYALSALAVVNEAGSLVGVISLDAAQEILEEEATEDVHRLVGTSPTQQTRLPILVRVRQRLPLMGVTVVGGLASARLLGMFMGPGTESPINEAILRYLPLIVGLAGNVGVQTSAILVRGFATGEVEREREAEVFVSEASVGTLIGALCGLVTFLFSAWLEGSTGQGVALGLSVGIAVFVAVTWAAALGGAVPMICRRMEIDPAVVAGPFLITLSDISGVAIYMVVADQLLNRLGQL